MKLRIRRTQEGKSYDESFDVASLRVTTLLSALYEIKAKLDPTLTFDAGCRSGVCGACAVRVNGREKLACSYIPSDGDLVEPLRFHSVLRDLKVDKSKAHKSLQTILPKTPLKESGHDNPPVSTKDEARYRLQSDCILCDSCYSACPVYAINPDFLAPFALSRAWRYLCDSRLDPTSDNSVSLETLQTNGIWDCTLCGECSAVCPQGIDPKSDIMQLRGESLKAGYSDPNFATQNFATGGFGEGFSFDPNAGF